MIFERFNSFIPAVTFRLREVKKSEHDASVWVDRTGKNIYEHSLQLAARASVGRYTHTHRGKKYTDCRSR